MARPATEQDTITLKWEDGIKQDKKGIFVNGSPVKMHFTENPETDERSSTDCLLEAMISDIIRSIAEDTGIIFSAERVRALYG